MTLILTRSADGRDRRVGRHRGTAHRRGSLEHAPLAGEPALAAAEREPAQGQRVPAHHSILGRVSRGPQCDRRSVGSSPATPAAGAAPCTLLRRVRSASQPWSATGWPWTSATAVAGIQVRRPSRRSTRSAARYENGHETSKQKAVRRAADLPHAARADSPRRSLSKIRSPIASANGCKRKTGVNVSIDLSRPPVRDQSRPLKCANVQSILPRGFRPLS